MSIKACFRLALAVSALTLPLMAGCDNGAAKPAGTGTTGTTGTTGATGGTVPAK